MNFEWLKRFMPRGLYGRAALILFLPVVVVTQVVTVMFLQRHFEGVTRQMTASMSHELTFVARLIDSAATPDAARRAGVSVARPLELELALPVEPPTEDRRLF